MLPYINICFTGNCEGVSIFTYLNEIYFNSLITITFVYNIIALVLSKCFVHTVNQQSRSCMVYKQTFIIIIIDAHISMVRYGKRKITKIITGTKPSSSCIISSQRISYPGSLVDYYLDAAHNKPISRFVARLNFSLMFVPGCDRHVQV